MHPHHRFQPAPCADDQSSEDELEKPPRPFPRPQSRSLVSTIAIRFKRAISCSTRISAAQPQFTEKEISRPRSQMAVRVCADDIENWIEIDEVKHDDQLDCYIISGRKAKELLSLQGNRYAEEKMEVVQPRTVRVGGDELCCTHKIAVSWRWTSWSRTQDAVLYVCPGLDGRCELVMPPIKEEPQETTGSSSVKPVCSTVLKPEEQRNQQQQNAQAQTNHQTAVQVSNENKRSKFLSQLKSNAAKIQSKAKA